MINKEIEDKIIKIANPIEIPEDLEDSSDEEC